MKTKKAQIFAVSSKDFQLYGCPNCGGIYGYSNFSGGGAAVWNCECGIITVLLAEGIVKPGIKVNDTQPELQEHPRKGILIDREKLIKERETSIKTNEFDRLTKWVRLGYGTNVPTKEVSSHTSKSQHLPIIGIGKSFKDSNVKVTWFGQNYHTYFLGVKLDQPVYAALMYPIIGLFGRTACSSHVNERIAPAITNFIKHYHNQEKFQSFGMEFGDGFFASLAIRYLHEISKLDGERIMDICLRKSRYGTVDVIHGNSIDSSEMLIALGFEGKTSGYDYDLTLSEESIFSKVQIDQFDTDLGNSSVRFTLKPDILLPALPMPGLYVKPSDTPLGKHLPQLAKEKSYSDKLIPLPDTLFKAIPASVLEYLESDDLSVRKKLFDPLYPVHRVYSYQNFQGKEFIMNVPNPLDASLTAIFLTKVVDPIVRSMLVTV